MRDELQAGPLHYGEVIWLGRSVADALAQVHRTGRVHGEVVPANIFWDLDGTPSLVGAGDELRPVTVTIPGVPKAFIAPEVAHGGPVTPAADIYSLGAVLAAALGGGPVPTGLTLQGPGTAMSDDETAAQLASVLAVAMATDPTERFRSATAFRDALDDILGGAQRRVAPRILVSAVLVVLVLLAGVTFLSARRDGSPASVATGPPVEETTTTSGRPASTTVPTALAPATSAAPDVTPTPTTVAGRAPSIANGRPVNSSIATTAAPVVGSPAPTPPADDARPTATLPDPTPIATPPTVTPGPTTTTQPPATTTTTTTAPVQAPSPGPVVAPGGGNPTPSTTTTTIPPDSSKRRRRSSFPSLGGFLP